MLDILVDLREGAQTPTIYEKHRSELNTPVVEGIFGEERRDTLHLVDLRQVRTSPSLTPLAPQ